MMYRLVAISPTLPEDGDFWVAPSAQVMGRVRIESGASIWFGAVLRGDNEYITLGARSNIQENCVCHTDIGFPLVIGAGCTIGHSAILHGCEIGDNSLIGMGATVLNGARIGKNCLIGAGALIPEGKVIPDNSLVVGMPGKVVRTLDAKEVDGLKASALGYQQKMRQFRDGLEPIG